MPLTSSGKKVLASMIKEHGSTEGKKVFYSSINGKKSGSEKWHKKSTSTYGAKEVMMARVMK